MRHWKINLAYNGGIFKFKFICTRLELSRYMILAGAAPENVTLTLPVMIIKIDASNQLPMDLQVLRRGHFKYDVHLEVDKLQF